MNASKEIVRTALERLAHVITALPENQDLQYVREVLQACEKRLPREASYEADKVRVRMKRTSANPQPRGHTAS
jgi:hypothetical protein